MAPASSLVVDVGSCAGKLCMYANLLGWRSTGVEYHASRWAVSVLLLRRLLEKGVLDATPGVTFIKGDATAFPTFDSSSPDVKEVLVYFWDRGFSNAAFTKVLQAVVESTTVRGIFCERLLPQPFSKHLKPVSQHPGIRSENVTITVTLYQVVRTENTKAKQGPIWSARHPHEFLARKYRAASLALLSNHPALLPLCEALEVQAVTDADVAAKFCDSVATLEQHSYSASKSASRWVNQELIGSLTFCGVAAQEKLRKAMIGVMFGHFLRRAGVGKSAVFVISRVVVHHNWRRRQKGDSVMRYLWVALKSRVRRRAGGMGFGDVTFQLENHACVQAHAQKWFHLFSLEDGTQQQRAFNGASPYLRASAITKITGAHDGPHSDDDDGDCSDDMGDGDDGPHSDVDDIRFVRTLAG